MKKLIYILFIAPLLVFSQIPQGVSYQAVAYDSDGFELSNKEVGVRISIVEGSAFGTPQLVEEHDVLTTEQGLFSLIIGQGALLGGEVESLLDIPWGSNTYFLKIELVTENNGSYMDFGTQQFMSVPYALYAESSGTLGPEGPEGLQGEQGIQGEPADPIDYDSLVNELILDSAFIADFGGGSGCNYQFPEGLNGEVISFNPKVNPFTVPNGKHLYILHSKSPTYSWFIVDDGMDELLLKYESSHNTPVIIGEKMIIKSESSYSEFINAVLVDSLFIKPLNIVKSSVSSFEIPLGKKLVVTSGYGSSLYIDGENTSEGWFQKNINLIINSSSIISWNDDNGYVGGYLVDEDYFENCGGGNNTLSSSIDYNALAEALVQDSVFLSNLSGGISMGNDLLFPEGINGEGISIDVSQSNPYFVPDGKRLYVMHWAGASPVLSGCSDYLNLLSPNPLILNAGQSISNEESNITSRLNGLLVPENDKLHGLSTDVSQSTPYVVPAGKRLYILSWTYNSPVINGMSDYVNLMNGCPLIMNSGESVYPEDNNAISRMNGYLVDEDYFEAPQAYVSDALQSTDEMFAAMQEQINTLDSLTALFEYKFELMNRPLQESLDLGIPFEDLYSVGYNKNDLIGLAYQGGIIFYVDETGQHGLISAIENLEEIYEWGCYGSNIYGANGVSLGTGYQNTIDILSAGCDTEGGGINAAEACDGYQVDNFNDWYLPSYAELELIKEALSVNSSNDNLFQFSTDAYTSSSQMSANLYYTSWFPVNISSPNMLKNDPNQVLPIRSF